ncbi:phosphate signaling complex protein PhoU [Thioalbus denitrificans]|uniref:Phosphate-specific transport system accessory protein PhoU n=1 Tax=Thioalbus denitrificans TaxID=547122 RepID=A0A369CDI0_9GAMM|nr:phosphate signaling complex protein PhoU [Thioalbus denitrificans]RCX31268.1 PhoU-like phosphate uptake regulator [Thioalbus denitrificans]
MTKPTEGHIVKRFDDQLTHLHGLVLQMGQMVIEQLQRSLRTLEEEDVETAREVAERDQEVNRLDIRVDDELVRVLAMRAPVGKDLREVMAVAKSVTDLERVGDEARRVAQLTQRLYGGNGASPNPSLLRDLFELGRGVTAALETTLRAFESLDLDLALEVLQHDETLDGEFQSALRRLSTYIMEDHRNVGHVVEVVLGLRALDRIGAHAKNIAGYIIYLANGRDVRHVPTERLLEELRAGG